MGIPLKAIRRELGKIERAAKELKKIQMSIALPLAEELEPMMTGRQPLSEEAYVLAVLQSAGLSHEEGTLDVRLDLSKAALRNPDLRRRSGRTDIDLGALIAAVRQEREEHD